MTTVTITIDDPNGLDSNLLFPSASPYRVVSSGTSNGTSGGLSFQRIVNGMAVDPRYAVTVTGNDITLAAASVDVLGDVTAMKLNLVQNDGLLGSQLMHVDFVLDGLWLTFYGGVHVESLAALTADVLMGRILQRTGANLILVGNVGNDTLNGSFLDDTLRGGAGADQLNGGFGNDTASYEFSNAGVQINLLTNTATGGHAAGDHFSSIENILGSVFADTIVGDAAANVIDGGFGLDTIDGGDGDDVIFGREGGGTLRGGAGNDRVDGGVEDDKLYGGTGNDELRVGDGRNSAYGEDGNDILVGNAGNDRLYGGAGNDVINAVNADGIVDGGLGIDEMRGSVGTVRYYVDDAADTVFDFGMGDGDTVFAAVSYTLDPTTLIETLSTTNASGTTAIDLTGSAIGQAINGNAGGNILDGRGGADTMSGLGGNDVYFVDDALDKVVEAANRGTDEVRTTVSWVLTAGSAVELLKTTNAAAVAAIDLTGNTLAQIIEGNKGSNVLDGKGGNDSLRGNSGSDTFAFTTALGSGNVDTIVDFSVAADTIRLENGIFRGLAAGVLSANAFVIGSAAQDADDRIVYNAANGALLFDRDGTGAAAAVRFATVSTGLAMTNNDFVVG